MHNIKNSYKVSTEDGPDTNDLNILHKDMVEQHPECIATVILTEIRSPALSDLVNGNLTVGLNTSTHDPIVSHYAMRSIMQSAILDVRKLERTLEELPHNDPLVRKGSLRIIACLKNSYENLILETERFDREMQDILTHDPR